MTNYQWIGSTSTSASTASNWSPSGTPAAGDVVIFDAGGTQDCVWDIALPASAFSVDEVILESTFSYSLTLNTNMRVKGLFLNGTIIVGSGTKILFEHGASPNFFGSYKTYNERFVLIGDSGDATGITFEMIGSSSPVTKFDDGAHPTVTLTTGRFAPDYVAPTGTSGKATFDSFTVTSPTDFSPDGDLVDNDRLKVFSFTAFSITSTSIDFGLATVEYYATSGGFYIPTAGATGMPTDFVAYYRKIVLKANTAGHKCLMSDNTFISVEEFEIDDGAVLKGPVDDTSQGADIRSIKTPKLRGTWSFSQITPGIYRSPRHASGPMPKVNGNFHITGKLDVDGLIDPTGLELTPVSSNPGGTAANTLWLNSGDSNKLYHGSSEVGGGGGGSGDITAVNVSAPITGGGSSGDVTVGISAATTSAAGSMSSADKTKLDGIEANAQVNVPLQHMRLYGKNTGSNLHTVTSGSRVYLDLGDTSKFAESTTGSHPDITVTNAATDYITIAAGGIYQITGHVGIFPASAPSYHDVWVEYNTNTSANRELGVSRVQHASNSTGNMNYKHSTVVEVPSTGSDINIYISVFSNGATANVRAYDNNRFFFTITRIGDSTV
jgi:hypothetical protein